MPVFKKKKQEKAAPLPDPCDGPVKTLDKRVGMDSFRDFFTCKNFWKTVRRNQQQCGKTMFAHKNAVVNDEPADSKAKGANGKETADNSGVPKLDARLEFDSYRSFFTLKNFYKTIRRQEVESGKNMFARFLKSNPGHRSRYAKLKNAPEEITAQCSDTGFETLSAQYLKVFDDVITALEEQSEDASEAIKILTSIGKMHRSKGVQMQLDDFRQMEEPFLKMVSDVLMDRYNDKAEMLFRKFFEFCLKYLKEGFSS
ncbi:Globin [Aphelenchoides besseyi]|nr:Globin [Aphelenchoides besseyi]